MNETILKSAGAVLAGLVTVFLLSIVTDVILEKPGICPPQNDPNSYVWWVLLLALVYRTIYTAVCGYCSQRIIDIECSKKCKA